MRKFVLLILHFFAHPFALGFVVDPSSGSAISLYSNQDNVIELVDANLTTIYQTDSIWLVQFYNHWCGHCQRFAPTWKSLAEDIKGWSPIVKVGAVNCAVQNCEPYQISGTPTIKVMNPGKTFFNTMWKQVAVSMDIEVLKNAVLQELAFRNDHDRLDGGLINGVSIISKNIAAPGGNLDDLFGRGEFAALIFANQYDTFPAQAVLDLQSRSDELPIHIVPLYTASSSIWGVAQPTLIMIKKTGEVVRQLPLSYSGIQARQIVRQEIEKYLAAAAPQPPSFGAESTSVSTTTSTTSTSSATTTTASTTSKYPIINIPATGAVEVVEDKSVTTSQTVASQIKDLVYMGDIEMAIQYAFKKEIQMQPMIEETKLRALLQFIDTLLNFIPNLRQPIRKFLISLREWPVIMELKIISGQQFKDKVTELESYYKPFDATPSEYVGCKGSSPLYRGYPCSLWTLFHTMSVNGAEKDLSYMYGSASIISKSMIGYIGNFFSCRECAANFQEKVNSLGYLPQAGNDTVIWIWTIHNMANSMLSGDKTEDPAHPKIQWPSAEKCPNCRFINTFHDYNHYHYGSHVVKEETWNLQAVLEYMHQVYGPGAIVNNISPKPSTGLAGSDIVELINMVKAKQSQNDIISKVEGMCQRLL